MFKKKNIFYSVDSVEKSEDLLKAKIRGWGISRCDQKPLKVELLNKKDYSVRIKAVYRKDVNEFLKLEDRRTLGYEIHVQSKTPLPKYFVLKFSDAYGHVAYKRVSETNVNLMTMKESFAFYTQLARNKGLGYTAHRLGVQKRVIWDNYAQWIYENETYQKRTEMLLEKDFHYRPKISIVTPVYNVERKWLDAFIMSVRNQSYSNWELCLADDCSTNPDVRPALEYYRDLDPRIKVAFRETNGHISKATNTALSLATGEYIGFMDNDDLLAPNALLEYIRAINEDKTRDFLYSDEDMITMQDKRFNPFFKNAWNEELLLNHNYITHFVVVSRELYHAVGPLDTDMNGSQDYDFVLRATEKAKKIHHIPKMLYHWRTIEGSVAENPEAKNYAYDAGKRALENALKRRGIEGEVEIGKEYGTYTIDYQRKENPTVDIFLLCQPDTNVEAVLNTIETIQATTDYPYYNLYLAGYPADFKVMEVLEKGVFVLKPKSINKMLELTDGDVVLFMNPYLQPLYKNWLSSMVTHLQRPHIGIVGGKILNAHGRVVNAGYNYNRSKNRLIKTQVGARGNKMGMYYRLMSSTYIFATDEDCLMVSRKDFDKVGGMDKNAPPFIRGIELCIKIAQLGLRVLFIPQASFYQPYPQEDTEELVLSGPLKKYAVDAYTNPSLLEREV